MRNLDGIKERYMQDSLPIRLGGLAADLARIHSFLDHPKNTDVIGSLLNESCWFVEWSAGDLCPERAEEAEQLVDIHRGLVRWYRNWGEAQHDPAQRAQLAEQAQAWSDQVLKMSGLLDQE